MKDSTAKTQWTFAKKVLLREIDKSDANTDKRLFFIGLSTNPSLVDERFIAKGRLEKIIYVPQPDLQARHRIIKLALGNSLVNFKLDILAKCTDKFSGADLVKLCSNARNRAITQFYDQAKFAAEFDGNDERREANAARDRAAEYTLLLNKEFDGKVLREHFEWAFQVAFRPQVTNKVLD